MSTTTDDKENLFLEIISYKGRKLRYPNQIQNDDDFFLRSLLLREENREIPVRFKIINISLLEITTFWRQKSKNRDGFKVITQFL